MHKAQFQISSDNPALDRMAAGVFLLGERGEVMFANRGAARLFAAADGLFLRREGPGRPDIGWLSATRADEEAVLREEIGRVVGRARPGFVPRPSSAVVVSRPTGKRPFVVQISPLALPAGRSGRKGEAYAIGFIDDLEASARLDADLLGRLYGLTAAETRLAEALLSGDALGTISARLAIKESTVKTHLKRIFEKTRTNRQAQLMKLLMGMAFARG
jgi:DNA-binding CsgD family transcriptional regulator